MKSKQVWMKSKSFYFDEIKSVLLSPTVISYAKQISSTAGDLFRRRTDLVKKSTNLVSRLMLFSGSGNKI